MIGKLLDLLAGTDRDKIGVIGGIWKSKKLGATFLWCATCVYAADLLFKAGHAWPAVAALGCGSLGVCAYLLSQGKVDSSNGE